MAALLSNDILYKLFGWLEVVDPASARDIGWIRATHVCRSWREASLGFHALWARNVCTFPSQVGTMLGRAAGAPLHVRITQDYPNFPLGEILIGLVRSQPSRLGLLNCGHWVQPFIFHSALSGKMFVNLVELEITYTNDSPHVEVDPMHAPNLERATIHGRYAPIIAPRLRMLVLQHCDRSQRVVGLSSALDILESSPLLDKIHIFGIFNDLPDTSTRTVVISNASDIILIGTDQSFMQHIRILNNGRGQLIVLYPRGPLFSAPYAASSLARIIPECHELTFHQTRGSRDLILRHPTIHLRFRRELIFDDVSHAMEDALARYLPLEYVRKLQVIDYPADSLSATLVTALRNVGELSCLALYNRFLDSLPEGAFPAVQIIHQKSLSPAHAESEGWERLERFLAKRVVSGHPVPTLRLTGLSGYVSEALLERLKTHISRLVDERMERKVHISIEPSA